MSAKITLRMSSFVASAAIIGSHFMGDINLAEPSLLWLALFASLNGFQASFTGFCPAAKIFGGKGDKCCSDGSCSKD